MVKILMKVSFRRSSAGIQRRWRLRLWTPAFAGVIAILGICLVAGSAFADTVIMKDGTVYKGKILIDTDKAVLIGNPPFDPNSYLLESKDIDTIVYEEYHANPPAERKRGLIFEGRLMGNVLSSQELSLSPTAGLYLGA